MSSGPSGKFQDHYIVLGVDPQSDSETIQAAYTKLAQKYHPSNEDTGSEERFETLNIAYEVLSDPELRLSFDKVKGVDLEKGDPKFSGPGFFHGLRQGTMLRSTILCVLYDRRRLKSFKPSLSMRHLEGMLRVNTDELNFALWYLKQRGLVATDDKSAMEITVDGMDYLEKHQPPEDAVMGFVKAERLLNYEAPKQDAPLASPTAKPAQEPILNLLNRALVRAGAQEENQPAVKK